LLDVYSDVNEVCCSNTENYILQKTIFFNSDRKLYFSTQSKNSRNGFVWKKYDERNFGDQFQSL